VDQGGDNSGFFEPTMTTMPIGILLNVLRFHGMADGWNCCCFLKNGMIGQE